MAQGKNLRKWLYSALSLLAIGPLILAGLSLAWFSFDVQQKHAINLQHELSRQAAHRIQATIDNMAKDLESMVNIPGFYKLSQREQQDLISVFRRHTDRRFSNTITEVTLLDTTGQEITKVSRDKIYTSSDLKNSSQLPEYQIPISTKKTYFSPVWFNQQTGDPRMTLSVPLMDILTAKVESIVILQVRLKELWEVVTSLPIGESGSAYIVTKEGRVVAHVNPSIVLRGTHFIAPDVDGLHDGISGEKSVITTHSVALGDQQLYIVTELPFSEAFTLILRTFASIGVFAIIGFIVSGILWFKMVKRIVHPVESLTHTAIEISDGDITKRVQIDGEGEGLHEIQYLASSFNGMVEQLESRENSLEQALWRAEAATRAKNTFLATMSHEIRTPMNGVLGMAQILEATDLNSEQREYLDVINQSGQALVTILNDILDFSKIEADKIELKPVIFDLEELSQDVLQLMTPGASKKGLLLILNYAPDCPRIMVADVGRLRQILLNLLSNAIKFTTTGRINLNIKGTLTDQHQTEIHVEVEDTGAGIDSETLQTIFDPFTQADGSNTRAYGGTGLGLAITKRLINLMGGTVGVKSDHDKGSTFWFKLTLPLDTSDKANKTDKADKSDLEYSNVTSLAPSKLPKFNGHILLVEDNATNQKMARSMLEQYGCQVTTANDGCEALAHLEQLDFDLILMDCQMPRMDGYSATQEIRSIEKENGQEQRIPIIALTARALDQDRQQCIAVGMDDYIAKPINRELLTAAIGRWLPRRDMPLPLGKRVDS